MTGPTPPVESVVVIPTLWSGPWVWREQHSVFAEWAPNLAEIPEAIVNWDVEPMLDALDAYVLRTVDSSPGPLALVGCSLGGLLALRVASLRPDRVSHVVASGCPGLGKGRDFNARARFRLTFEEACKVRAELFTDPACMDDDLLRASVDEVTNRPAVRRATRLIRLLDAYDAGADVRRLSVPTSLIWGADDQLSPPARWRQLARACEGVRFREVAGAGHVPMLEAPHAFAEILRAELRLADGLP